MFDGVLERLLEGEEQAVALLGVERQPGQWLRNLKMAPQGRQPHKVLGELGEISRQRSQGRRSSG